MSISTEPTFADQYKCDGYAIVPNLLTSESLTALRERITELAEGKVSTFPTQNLEFEPRPKESGVPRKIRKINRCAESDSVFFENVTQPQIVDLVAKLIGPDIKLFGSQCFMKPPGGVAKPYHQDSAYFTIEPLSLVTCWIALDDVTTQNGCMWVIPGSHLGELHDHSQQWDAGDRMDMQVPDDKIDFSREVAIEMPAGSCSFHHSMLLHRSGPNHSEVARRGLAVHFMSSTSRWTSSADVAPTYRLVRGQEYPGCV